MPTGNPDPISDTTHALGNWWRRSLKPALGGFFGGFGVAMLACTLSEALGVASRSPTFDNIAASSMLVGGMAIYWAMRRAAFSSEASRGRERTQQAHAAGKLTLEQSLQSQVDRISIKARRLQKRARKDAGVYANLATYAPELERQARDLVARFLQLRAAAQEIGGGRPGTPAAPPEEPPAHGDSLLRREYDAAQATQRRVEELLVENDAEQQLCLTRLERTEDLLDAAWLEVSQAAVGVGATAASPTIVQEMETELQAAREAVEEVQEETRRGEELA